MSIEWMLFQLTLMNMVKSYLEGFNKGWFSISNIEHKDLITQMRTARYKKNGNLDKAETSDSTFDTFDSARLALKMFPLAKKAG